MKQLRDATDVLMRFLEEYETVNPQNSDAIVEYEGKLELIAAPLSTKEFATLDSYSLVDLLKAKTEYAESQSTSFGVLFAEWRGGFNGSTQHLGRSRLALKTKTESLAAVR
jgi:hypothetical protein